MAGATGLYVAPAANNTKGRPLSFRVPGGSAARRLNRRAAANHFAHRGQSVARCCARGELLPITERD